MTYTPVDVVLIDQRQDSDPPMFIASECEVNGTSEELTGVSIAEGTLTVSITVDASRVSVDLPARTVLLDGEPVLLRPFGYRPQGSEVQLDLIVNSLTTRVVTREHGQP